MQNGRKQRGLLHPAKSVLGFNPPSPPCNDLAQILKLPDDRENYAGLGVVTVHTTSERVLELVRIEVPKMGKVLKAVGVEPD